MNFWDTSAEFGPSPREKTSSLMMPREEATANAEGVEKTGKSEQRQLFLVCAPVSHSSAQSRQEDVDMPVSCIPSWDEILHFRNGRGIPALSINDTSSPPNKVEGLIIWFLEMRHDRFTTLSLQFIIY